MESHTHLVLANFQEAHWREEIGQGVCDLWRRDDPIDRGVSVVALEHANHQRVQRVARAIFVHLQIHHSVNGMWHCSTLRLCSLTGTKVSSFAFVSI